MQYERNEFICSMFRICNSPLDRRSSPACSVKNVVSNCFLPFRIWIDLLCLIIRMTVTNFNIREDAHFIPNYPVTSYTIYVYFIFKSCSQTVIQFYSVKVKFTNYKCSLNFQYTCLAFIPAYNDILFHLFTTNTPHHLLHVLSHQP